MLHAGVTRTLRGGRRHSHLVGMKNRDLAVYVAGGIIVVALLAFSVTRLARKPQLEAPVSVAPVTVTATTTTSSADDSTASVHRIPLADVRKLVEQNAVTLIDVRDADAYLASHIPGALHIPVQYLEGEIDYLPKGKPIVTYCT